MPQIEPGEKREHYLARCPSYIMKEGKTENSKQAYAICVGLWNKHHRKSKGESLIDGLMDNFLENKK